MTEKQKLTALVARMIEVACRDEAKSLAVRADDLRSLLNSHHATLEALEEISREYDGFLDGDCNPCPTLAKARAAIRLARGEG